MKVFELASVLDANWLETKSAKLEIRVKQKVLAGVYRIKIAELLFRQLKDLSPVRKALFLQTHLNVSKRSCFDWFEKKFDAREILPKVYPKYIALGVGQDKEEFQIIVIDKKGVEIGECRASMLMLLDFVMPIIGSEKPALKAEIVFQQREIQLAEAGQRRHFKDEQERDALMLQICNDYAGAVYSLDAILFKFGMPLMQWNELLYNDEYSRACWSQAVAWRNRHLINGVADEAILLIKSQLTRGQYIDTDVHKVKKIVPGQAEPIWVEKSANERKTSFRINELAGIFLALKKIDSLYASSDTSNPEFTGKTEIELIRNIFENPTDEIIEAFEQSTALKALVPTLKQIQKNQKPNDSFEAPKEQEE